MPESTKNFFCCGLLMCGTLLTTVGCQKTVSAEQPEKTAAAPVDPDEAMIGKIIELNSKTIAQYGRMAELAEETSDMLMRLSHYTDGHAKRVALCPECAPRVTVPEVEVDEPEEDLPKTMQQLLDDANEIYHSARGIAATFKNQQVAVELHLNKLREGKPKPAVE